MAMELEGRRSSDNNWYHCQISICSKEKQNVLKVLFSEGGEEYILTPIEAQSRLRPVSKSLEKGECKRLQVGDTVLVPSDRLELGKSGFFEAHIRNITRRRHSAAARCKCELEVVCVGAEELSCSVLASQVRLVDLSSSIDDNPVFCDWVGGNTAHSPHRSVTSDAEIDMHAQLDEQINKIFMLTESLNETSTSTTPFLADGATKTRRTTRNRTQANSYVENRRRLRKDSSITISKSRLSLHIQPRLSPLAARAALAATVLTTPLRQVKSPSSPVSKVLSLDSSKHTSGTMPERAEQNASTKRGRRGRKPKAKGK